MEKPKVSNPKEMLEVITSENEFLKQVITLSTGSIVLLCSLMEKFTAKATHNISLRLSLVLFALATVTSLVTFLFGGWLSALTKGEDIKASVEDSYFWGVIAAFTFFFSGIASLTIFGWNNF
jgi:hypothetical protein